MRNALAILGLAFFASCQGTPPDDCTTTNTCASDDAAVPSPDLTVATCAPACGGATPYCTDKHNCVSCLVDDNCPAGQVCEHVGNDARCVPGCNDDARCRAKGGSLSCCAMSCTDTTSDAANCGGCGMRCAPDHGVGQCAAGKCNLMGCAPGFGDCDANGANGCEVNLHVSPTDCGACGMGCSFPNGIAGCADGCYLRSCNFGWDDCNGNAKDGCEKSVLSDAKNCGACGNSCNGSPHSHGTCVNAACQLVCDLGWSDCDGNAANGCELPTSADAKNCGACGNVCAGNLVCVASSCTCPNCQLPNSKTRCVNNQCVLDSCNAGFADCDNNQANGCEVNLLSDAANCTACGKACPQGMSCQNGVCSNQPVWVFGNYNNMQTFFMPNVQYNGTVNCITTCGYVNLKPVGVRFICNHWDGGAGEGCDQNNEGQYGNANCGKWIDRGMVVQGNGEDCAGNIAGCLVGNCQEGVTWHAIQCQCM